MPQTVEHYESQLASYLSMEQYEQAAELLQFLLHYTSADVESRLQWEQLLSWLHMMFPELLHTSSGYDEQTEDELRKQTLDDKWSQSPAHIADLLHTLDVAISPEKQLITLEQLAYHGGSEAIEGVRNWLTHEEKHPLLQFKAMQTLKQAGDERQVCIPRSGEILCLSPNDFPLDFDEIPYGIESIFNKIKTICESSDPIIGEFASQMKWDVIATSCGTRLYQEMSEVGSHAEASVWASAFHSLLEMHIFGISDEKRVLQLYDIPMSQLDEWRARYGKCGIFFSVKEFMPSEL